MQYANGMIIETLTEKSITTLLRPLPYTIQFNITFIHRIMKGRGAWLTHLGTINLDGAMPLPRFVIFAKLLSAFLHLPSL